MALHSRWSSGNLEFYDGTQTVMVVPKSTGIFSIGESGEGMDIRFYGDTTGSYMEWDESANNLLFIGGAGIEFDGGDISVEDGDYVNFGDSDDVTMRWTTGAVFEVLPLAANADVYLGSTSKPLDIVNYGNITYRDPATVAATGTVTLTAASNRTQFIKISTGATGGIALVLPAAAAGNAGIEFKVFNNTTGGDYPLTANLAVATGAAVITLQQQEGGILISDGTNWAGLVGGVT